MEYWSVGLRRLVPTLLMSTSSSPWKCSLQRWTRKTRSSSLEQSATTGTIVRRRQSTNRRGCCCFANTVRIACTLTGMHACMQKCITVVNFYVPPDTCRPLAVQRLKDFRRSSSVLEHVKTLAPCRASSSTIPHPMPLVPPVTRQFLPANV